VKLFSSKLQPSLLYDSFCGSPLFCEKLKSSFFHFGSDIMEMQISNQTSNR